MFLLHDRDILAFLIHTYILPVFFIFFRFDLVLFAYGPSTKLSAVVKVQVLGYREYLIVKSNACNNRTLFCHLEHITSYWGFFTTFIYLFFATHISIFYQYTTSTFCHVIPREKNRRFLPILNL